MRYRQADGASVWGDGGSRIGATASYRLKPSIRLFSRGEIGFNLLDELDKIFQPGVAPDSTHDNSVFLRLLYAGVETPHFLTTFGKNWSTYHQVASFTDRFDASGGSASGQFNARTDGGAAGTGRAAGIDGDARALLLGTRWFGDDWYVGTTVSFLNNIQTTEQGIYFAGNGWELYAQRRLKGRLWLVAGFNYLKPDTDEENKDLIGKYTVRHGVPGLRYNVGKKGTRIYLEGRRNTGSNTDGSDIDNVVTLGFRWDLGR